MGEKTKGLLRAESSACLLALRTLGEGKIIAEEGLTVDDSQEGKKSHFIETKTQIRKS